MLGCLPPIIPYYRSQKLDDLILPRATNCTLPEGVKSLLRNTLSENTQRAYRSDIAAFQKWGGGIPSAPEQLATYIAETAQHLSVPTVRRHLSALVFAHETLGLKENPAKSALVRSTLKGASRLYGAGQRSVEPLLVEDLQRILLGMDDRTIAIRNKALLCLGFAGGFRRSELVALNIEDLELKPEGLKITIRGSKTDQEKRGRLIGIPYARGICCPVRMTQNWMDFLEEPRGPLFRNCRKGGQIQKQRLSAEAVAIIIKQSAASIGLTPENYSGHSLRTGFVTSAIRSGAPSHLVRRQTGHASDATMARYIRLGNLFSENATSWIL